MKKVGPTKREKRYSRLPRKFAAEMACKHKHPFTYSLITTITIKAIIFPLLGYNLHVVKHQGIFYIQFKFTL